MLHRPSFDYKFEEPLYNLHTEPRFFKKSLETFSEEPIYNLDTEPRFFKKTLETLSGFLTHTFSSEDAKDNKKQTQPPQSQKPVLRNPLENIKPVKFPHAAIHNYQEVPHITYAKEPSHHSHSKEVVKPQPITVRPSTNHLKQANLVSNSWKPSQRL